MNRLFPILPTFLLLLASAPAGAETLDHVWSDSFGDTNWQDPSAVATDADGNIFLVGTNGGTVDYGGGALTSAGSGDMVLVKLDPDGHHLWSRGFGDSDNDAPVDLAVTRTGDVIVCGHFEGTIDFGGIPLVSAGDNDVFLARFDGATGAMHWSRSFGDATVDVATAVAIDEDERVYLCGYFSGGVDFGGGALVSAGEYDLFVAAFSSSGTHVWSFAKGGADTDLANDLAVHPSGSVCVTGSFQGVVDFGGGYQVSAGNTDVFLGSYALADGQHVYSVTHGDADSDVGRALAVDHGGDVVLCGYFRDTIFTGGAMLVSTESLDAFIARFDSGGALMAARGIGGAGAQLITDMEMDSAGHVLVTGEFYTEIDLGGGPIPGLGNNDIFLAKYDGFGGYIWGATYGGSAYQWPGDVTTDGARNVILFASSEQSIDLGGGPLSHAGATDQVLAKYAIDPAPAITAATDIGNDQGRQVRLDIRASSLDAIGSPTPILQYEAFRRVDDLGGKLADWEYVGAVPAHAEDVYSMVVPTLADSTADGGVHWSVYFVRAATASPAVFFDSAPDSGYSLDNLAPAVPTGLMLAGGELSWDEPTEPDFDYFTVYASAAPDLADAEIVGYATDPALDVSGVGSVFLLVTATDFAGNEGEPAVLDAATGAGEMPMAVRLLGAAPNPFNPRTTILFELPGERTVDLRIYSVAGRLVRELLRDAPRTVGTHRVDWDGRDDGGRAVPAGLYVYRLSAGSVTDVGRVMLVR